MQLALDGDQLVVNAPAVPDSLRTELTRRKPEIVEFLMRHAAPAPAVESDAVTEIPLSSAQQRIRFHDSLDPGNPVYNVISCWRIRGQLDVRALESALADIVRRHEVLGTSLSLRDSQPVQVFTRGLPVTLERLTPEGPAEACLRERMLTRFDISRGPVFRFALVEACPEEHLFGFAIHHFACDGWSLSLLLGELTALYSAFAAGRPSPLKPLPLQYSDFIRWERGVAASARAAEQLAYWERRFADPVPTLALPADRTAEAGRESCDRITRTLDARLWSDVEALARAERATPFMVLLAAFHALLQRYTGVDDIVIGSAAANRGAAGTEELIGAFVNMLPLRLQLRPGQSFRSQLADVRTACLEAFANQDVPFDRLVRVLRPQRATVGQPLFRAVMALHEETLATLRLDGLETEAIPIEQSPQFDLTLSVRRGPEQSTISLEYNASLFSPDLAGRMLDHYLHLLPCCLERSDDAIDAMPLATPEDEFTDWSRGQVRPLAGEGALARFERCAAAQPDATAMVFRGRHLTYDALNAHASRVAEELRAAGAGLESLVAVLLPRSPELAVAELGALKCGSAFAPVDPLQPDSRIQSMLDRLNPTVVIISAGTSIDLSGRRSVTIDLEKEAPRHGALSAPASDPAGLAYAICTSGSTGAPKVVLLEHAGLENLVAWHSRTFDVAPGDRIAVVTSPGVDAAVWDIFSGLTTGATLCIAPDHARVSATSLRDWLLLENITLAFLPTPLAEGIVRLSGRKKLALRSLLTGGDHLRIKPEAGDLGFPLLNHYGPTENTVVSTWTPAGIETEQGPAPTIGRPIDNTTAYVLDGALRPLPAGMPGELYVGGPGLARAYLGMPSETAEAFLPDPFATRPGCRMFRTGDRARWTAQGNIEFLGRVDGQLKIRGFRVERDEIETVIRSLPSVQSCAVTAYEPDPGNPMLVAYVVGRGARPSIPDLRRQVAERLPAHMAPARYVVLEQLPLTPLGKPDRRALPPPVFAADHEAAVPPRSDLERRIAAIWAAVLQVPEVGIHDNFFDLGGHSLLVTDLHARLEAALGRQFPIVDLFNHPTVAAIGARLAGSSDGADAQAAASDLASKRKAALERLSAKTRRGAAAGAAPAQQLGEP